MDKKQYLFDSRFWLPIQVHLTSRANNLSWQVQLTSPPYELSLLVQLSSPALKCSSQVQLTGRFLEGRTLGWSGRPHSQLWSKRNTCGRRSSVTRCSASASARPRPSEATSSRCWLIREDFPSTRSRRRKFWSGSSPSPTKSVLHLEEKNGGSSRKFFLFYLFPNSALISARDGTAGIFKPPCTAA